MPKADLILLAIEDQQMVPMFERALTAASYKVAVAHDRAALDKLVLESTPALIVLSEKFSGALGIKISEVLLERFPTLPIILFVTQTLPLITIKETLRIGISDMISPPLKIHDIMTAVENSLMRAKRIGDWTRREVRRTTASLERRIGELIKLETIIDHIDDGVMILDEKHNILLINPAMRRSFGLWQEDYEGKPVLDIIPNPDLRTILTENSEGASPHNEIAFEDGRVYNAQYAPIPGIGTAITIQDITYLHQIDRLKSEFISTVSHDLRSPLTAILGYVELLERVGPINDAQREFIARVQVSVQSITSLVNDLLELGRIEAGVDSQKELIPLDSIMQLTAESYDAQTAEKGVRLYLVIPKGKSVEIRGNPIRLRQMMDNLIGNAVKYTPEGGEISVELEEQSEQIIIRIADNGPGIPPADQAHIFEKFYRATNVPKGVGGSGLGLAIVKSIVDNHHGRIWVESIVGKGSTFVVVLPMYKADNKILTSTPKK
jgi:PAS domain S-box-containing protein